MELAANDKEERVSYSRPPLMSKSHPWLVFVHGKHRQRQTFFSISEDRYYVRVIPEMRNKSICSSSRGWLLLKDLGSDDYFFLNLISLENIQLPPIPWKVTSWLIVVPPEGLIFICEEDGVNYFVTWIRGDSQYYLTIIEVEEDEGDEEEDEGEVEDEGNRIILGGSFKGRFYGITYPGFNLVQRDEIAAGSRDRFRQLIGRGSLPFKSHSPWHKLYMVTSRDELFLVFKFYSISHPDVVLDFEIFRADFSKRVWEKVKSLGKHTIFLSTWPGESYFVSGGPGIKSNSIYFTQGRYLHVYNLEDRSISISLPCPLVANQHVRTFEDPRISISIPCPLAAKQRSFQYWINF